MPCSSVELCRCSHIWMWHDINPFQLNLRRWSLKIQKIRPKRNNKLKKGLWAARFLWSYSTTRVNVWPHDWFVDWHGWKGMVLVSRFSKRAGIFLPPPEKCRYLTPTPKLYKGKKTWKKNEIRTEMRRKVIWTKPWKLTYPVENWRLEDEISF